MGLYVRVPVVRHPIEKWLGSHLAAYRFSRAAIRSRFFAAGLVLAIMTIPIITAVSRDSMKAVPNETA